LEAGGRIIGGKIRSRVRIGEGRIGSRGNNYKRKDWNREGELLEGKSETEGRIVGGMIGSMRKDFWRNFWHDDK